MAAIPNSIQISSSITYEILWAKKIFKYEHCYGVTKSSKKEIILEQDHTAYRTVHTYVHEIIHAYSDEYNLNLTETQVLGIEKILYFVLKQGNLFKL